MALCELLEKFDLDRLHVFIGLFVLKNPAIHINKGYLWLVYTYLKVSVINITWSTIGLICLCTSDKWAGQEFQMSW